MILPVCLSCSEENAFAVACDYCGGLFELQWGECVRCGVWLLRWFVWVAVRRMRSLWRVTLLQWFVSQASTLGREWTCSCTAASLCWCVLASSPRARSGSISSTATVPSPCTSAARWRRLASSLARHASHAPVFGWPRGGVLFSEAGGVGRPSGHFFCALPPPDDVTSFRAPHVPTH